MKVPFKINGKREDVQFNISPTRNGGFTVIAKSSKDLDKLQDLISSDDSTMVVQKGLESYIEKKLGLVVYRDDKYQGAGYGFKLDMYYIIDKLK